VHSDRNHDWLRVELNTSGQTSTLALCGMLCGTSIAALEAQIDQLGCTPCDAVTIDLRQLQALDKSGARMLLGLYHYVTARGGRYRIVGATGQVAQTIRDYFPRVTCNAMRMVDARFPGLVPGTAQP
jgi:anti-anti-sigma factor